ncbi:hypothetical protein [Kibdelosporangium aridum]|uniref:hypothetical protein n=1 Tax=Kibdelosporangium aridum TaxID=2030 RepID=UPI0035E54407
MPRSTVGLLGGPGSGRMCGDAGDVQPPCVVFEEDQGVQAFQAEGVDVEEVAGDHAGGLRGEELAPGWAAAARAGVDAGRMQDLPDGRGGDGVSEPGQFTLDAAVAPSAVFAGEV